MRRRSLISFAALAAFTMIPACTSTQDAEEIPTGISIDVDRLSFSDKASSQVVSVRSGNRWSISGVPEWLTINSIGSGKASMYEWSITLTVASNEGYDRAETISFRAGSKTVGLRVSQLGIKGEYVAVESVSISSSKITLSEDKVESLVATILPSDASDKSVSWSSTNTSVVTVSSTGLVTAHAVGTAVITVKTNDGSKTASCSVKVADFNGHDYVDLGLPSGKIWATCNVGASKPEDYGYYYAWGEIETKTEYSWATYKWCNGSNTTLTKYNDKNSFGIVDNKSVLEIEDDVAHVKYGAKWRVPTAKEWDELLTYCASTWTTKNGVNGMLFTGKNDKSMFLPAAGYHQSTYMNCIGTGGLYWSSSLSADRPDYASRLKYGTLIYQVPWDIVSRYNGFSVRPISD